MKRYVTLITGGCALLLGASCGTGTSSEGVLNRAVKDDLASITEQVRDLKRSKPDSALLLVSDALKEAQDASDQQQVWLLEELMGEVLIASSSATAIGYCDSIVMMRRSGSDREALGRALMWAGNAWAVADRYPVADSLMSEAERMLGPSPGLLARVRIDRANVRVFMGAVDEAEVLLIQALSAGDTVLVPADRLRALITYGTVAAKAGRFDTAQVVLEQAVEHAGSLGDSVALAKALGNLSTVVFENGRYAESLELAERAAVVAERMGMWINVVQDRYQMGLVHDRLQRVEEAFGTHRATARMVDSLGLHMFAPYLRSAMAMTLGQMEGAAVARVGFSDPEHLDTAIAWLRTAHTQLAPTGDLQRLSSLQHGIADLCRMKGDLAAARQHLDTALRQALPSGDPLQVARVRMGMGQLAMARRDHRGAQQAYEAALVVFEQQGVRQQVQSILDSLATVHARSGRWSEAYAAGRRARVLASDLYNDSTTQAVADVQAQAAYQRRQLADSLAHVQQLALERAKAEARIERQRTRTLAAAGGGVLLVLSGGVAFVLDRRRRKQAFARRTAELEREAARFETQALRSQMNPHFIFNALNSIAGYIQGNDPDRAQTFLARFAKLMRAVLENSRFAEVPLDKDLEVLRAYMELERIRAQGKFDFSIQVDPALDPADVLVPPLLAQPFVENAIWHGVAGKEGTGHITVHVERAEGQLRIRVEDDGVGRGVQRSAVSKDKTSLGTAITRGRLDLVRKQKGASAGFAYVDVPVGTRVEIHLPLELAA